jgi:hypothetical protein
MSYDLMVFRKDAAPKKRNDFLKWSKRQTEWTEGHSYDNTDYQNNENSFRSLSGLSLEQWRALLPYFEEAHNEYLTNYDKELPVLLHDGTEREIPPLETSKMSAGLEPITSSDESLELVLLYITLEL